MIRTAEPIPPPMPAAKSFTFRVLVVVLPLLLIGGLAAAYSLPRRVWESIGVASKKTVNEDELPPCCRARGIAAKDEATELPLNLAAGEESQLAALQLAADAEGRVFLAWGQPTSESEWTLYLATSLDGGAKFDPPRKLATAISSVKPHLVVTSEKVELLWDEATADGLKTKKLVSTNGGLSFDLESRSSLILPESHVVGVYDSSHLRSEGGHQVWEEEIPSDKEQASGRMIMYSSHPQEGKGSEPKAVRPRIGATQGKPSVVLVKDAPVVAFYETDAKGTRIVISRVQ